MEAFKISFEMLSEESVSKILVKIVQILGKLTRRNFEYLRPISENQFPVNPKFYNIISDISFFAIEDHFEPYEGPFEPTGPSYRT